MSLRKMILIGTTAVATIAATSAMAAPTTTTNTNGDESVKQTRVVRHHASTMQYRNDMRFQDANDAYGHPDRW